FQHAFYIVLANLLFFTSMKAFVELGFILPYYIRQSYEQPMAFGYFSYKYQFLIFNISVLADYGVLFFSVLIAVNRLFAVTKITKNTNSVRLVTACTCLLVWVSSFVIPIILFVCECQYVYSSDLKIYYNDCKAPTELTIIVNSLQYISYACAVIVLMIYASIFSVMALQYIESIGYFDLAYIENLLNLSIAAVYPICFLTMSGDMKKLSYKVYFSKLHNQSVSLYLRL
ncbi:hypothetical protein PENTCL1PPCAC_16150, partial [Pristionchus entomophagus]